MTRNEVIAILGEPDGVLDEAPLLVEEYDQLRVQPGYDDSGRLTAVQLVDRHPFSIQGLYPAGREYDEVRHQLEERGIKCESPYDALALPELGVHLYAPKYNPDDPRPIEAVLVGSRDYEGRFGAAAEDA